MKAKEMTQAEVDDLVQNGNPFKILWLIVLGMSAGLLLWVITTSRNLLIRFLICVLEIIKWIVTPFCKKDDDISQSNQ